MTDFDGFRMYFGTANGSARKALRVMEEAHVLVSAQSERGVPWDGIDTLFVDSGGYSLMLGQGDHPPADDYLDTVVDYDADLFATQDYPCEPAILDEHDRTVRDHQVMTTEKAAECIARAEDRGLDASPVVTIQGWEVDDYVRHVADYKAHGLLTDTVSIGSVCRRQQAGKIRRILQAVARELPDDTNVHAFGVKQDILADPDTRAVLDSADTSAWYYRNYDHRTEVDDTWQEMVSLYLEYRRGLARTLDQHVTTRDGQLTLTESAGDA